jgi:hypothetical protein
MVALSLHEWRNGKIELEPIAELVNCFCGSWT